MLRFLTIVSVAVCVITAGQASAADFAFSFDWGNIARCTTGNPNSVPNPKFSLRGVPAATASIQFRMVDLAVPQYQHGGGTVKYTGSATIAPGAFRYQSPCPPNGRHTYEWTATAKDASGKKLGQAKARRSYP